MSVTHCRLPRDLCIAEVTDYLIVLTFDTIPKSYRYCVLRQHKTIYNGLTYDIKSMGNINLTQLNFINNIAAKRVDYKRMQIQKKYTQLHIIHCVHKKHPRFFHISMNDVWI